MQGTASALAWSAAGRRTLAGHCAHLAACQPLDASRSIRDNLLISMLKEELLY